MSNIVDRQTFVISVALFGLHGATTPSQVSLPMNLRFAADELRLKSISYNNNTSLNADISNTVQIWCNITNDNLIGAFPNSTNACYQHDEHFRISNSFQSSNLILQFLQTDTATSGSYNPQALISVQNAQETFGTVVITIEFVKLKNKDIY